MIKDSKEEPTFEKLMDLLYEEEKLATQLFQIRETIKQVASGLWQKELQRNDS